MTTECTRWPRLWSPGQLWEYMPPSTYPFSRAVCPREHRFPMGPNEDIGQCKQCGAPTFELRPEGETYGLHDEDCSLPVRHEGWCEPGGTGHPRAARIRGYWP